MSKKNSKKGKYQSHRSPIKNTSNPSPKTSNASKLSNATLTPKPSFTVTISMLSDWHIGTGAGRTGDVDRLVQRDKDNLPYIPAKTLTGIWRDACELVALGLDNDQLDNGHDRPSWQKWVSYLFGDQPALAKGAIEKEPREAALSIRSAHLPESLIKTLAGKTLLKDAITFVKPGISINPESGCAIEENLRFEEMVRGGTELEANCEFNLPEEADQQRAAYALLLAGAQIVERLGGKRRRGAGQCKLTIEEDNKPWIDWLEHWIKDNSAPPLLPNMPEKENLPITGKPFQDENWLILGLKITTQSPVIIPTRTIGNVVETLDYIPGTYLLSLIRKKLGNLSKELNRAIAHGDVVVTNATVEIDDTPGRPVPFALFSEKLGGGLDRGKVYNRLQEREPDGQLKGERAGYIGCLKNSDFLPNHKKVTLTVESHNTVQDDYQCPTKETGGVYSYEAIEPGTIFQAELKLRQGVAEVLNKQDASWRTKIQGKGCIGQSKKDDYGLISIDVVGKPSSVFKTPKVKGSELVVWLLSDMLIRDERLRPTTSIQDLAKELGSKLGVNLIEKKSEENLDTLSLITRHHRIDSWHVRWGLPRPSLVGLAAGSCILFTADQLIAPSQLAEVQVSGIGERRAEGYGQLCFNDPVLTSDISKLRVKEKSNNEGLKSAKTQLISKSDRSFNYAQIVEKAAWREAIRRAALRVASSERARKTQLGIDAQVQTNSQLGSLRSMIRTLKVETENGKVAYRNEKVILWLNNLAIKDRWTHQSRNKVLDLVNTPGRVWDILQLPFSDLTLTQTGEQDLKTVLWTEAVQTLIDACIRAHKRENENKPEMLQVAGGVEHGA